MNSTPKQEIAQTVQVERQDYLIKTDNEQAFQEHLEATKQDPLARQWLMANMGLWKQ